MLQGRSTDMVGSMHACNQSVDLTYFRTTAANLAATHLDTDAHLKEHDHELNCGEETIKPLS